MFHTVCADVRFTRSSNQDIDPTTDGDARVDQFNEPGCDALRPSYKSIKSKLTDGRDLPASARFTTPQKTPRGIMIPPASANKMPDPLKIKFGPSHRRGF